MKEILSVGLLVIGVILMSTGVSVIVNAGSVSLAPVLCAMLGGFVFAAGTVTMITFLKSDYPVITLYHLDDRRGESWVRFDEPQRASTTWNGDGTATLRAYFTYGGPKKVPPMQIVVDFGGGITRTKPLDDPRLKRTRPGSMITVEYKIQMGFAE